MTGRTTADAHYERLQRALETCLQDITAEEPTTDEAKLIRECSRKAVCRALVFVYACRYADTPASTINNFGIVDPVAAADGQRRPDDLAVLKQFSRDLDLKEPHHHSWPTVLAARLVVSMNINKLPARETSTVYQRLMKRITATAGLEITPGTRRVALHRARHLVQKSRQRA